MSLSASKKGYLPVLSSLQRLKLRQKLILKRSKLNYREKMRIWHRFLLRWTRQCKKEVKEWASWGKEENKLLRKTTNFGINFDYFIKFQLNHLFSNIYVLLIILISIENNFDGQTGVTSAYLSSPFHYIIC